MRGVAQSRSLEWTCRTVLHASRASWKKSDEDRSGTPHHANSCGLVAPLLPFKRRAGPVRKRFGVPNHLVGHERAVAREAI